MARRGDPIDGVMLLDKPLGMSSNAALQTVRRLVNAQKAGHTGTLDPMATGLLPLCFGNATKFSADLLHAEKGYVARVKLGEVSSTGDAEGEIVERHPVDVTAEALEEAVAAFLGEIVQIPPMYSALKVNGKCLYQLARQGRRLNVLRARSPCARSRPPILTARPSHSRVSFPRVRTFACLPRTSGAGLGAALI